MGRDGGGGGGNSGVGLHGSGDHPSGSDPVPAESPCRKGPTDAGSGLERDNATGSDPHAATAEPAGDYGLGCGVGRGFGRRRYLDTHHHSATYGEQLDTHHGL